MKSYTLCRVCDVKDKEFGIVTSRSRLTYYSKCLRCGDVEIITKQDHSFGKFHVLRIKTDFVLDGFKKAQQNFIKKSMDIILSRFDQIERDDLQ